MTPVVVDCAESAGPVTDRRFEWRVEPGPLGRGECLVAGSGGNLAVLLPPGVPAELPEETSSLLQWRQAHWIDGELAASPKTLSLQEVVELANGKAVWALQQSRDRERLLKGAGLDVTETVEPLLKRLLAPDSDLEFDVRFEWRVRPTSLTGHPRSFASEIAQLDDLDLLRQVRRLVDSTSAFDECAASCHVLNDKVGDNRMRIALLALLHVRARSRSWRATKWFAPEHLGTDLLSAELASAIDSASSGLLVEQRVSRIAESCPDIDDRLLRILYMRSHSRRWLWTKPARRACARPTALMMRRVVHRHATDTKLVDPPSTTSAETDDQGIAHLRRVV